MKTVAVIHADLEMSPLGTASRLSAPLAGIPVLTRTLRRVESATGLDDVVVTCPAEHYEQVCALRDGCRATVKKFDGPHYPARRVVRLARKWSLDGWRGGMGNTCFFDEHTDPALCAAVASQIGAEVVVSVPAGAPLIDPQLIDDMIAHYSAQSESTKLVFAQSPPGLTPALFSAHLLAQLAQEGLSPGWVNSYRPDQPRRDMVSLPSCYRPALEIQTAVGRLTSDTRRSFETLERLLAAGGDDLSAAEACRALLGIRQDAPPTVPREVQIELTTEDQHHQTLLRPRGAIVGRRGPLDPALLPRILDDLAAYDDTTVVLGGFGEPLLHPQFADILADCRRSGVLGLAVRTNGLALDQTAARAMIDHDVDVVHFLLDAADDAGYRRVHGCDGWEVVTRNIDTLNRLRQSCKKINPIILGGLVKSRETLDALPGFYDKWLQHSGWVVVEGYSHHAGLLPDRAVMSMAPPKRVPCRQPDTRCTVLSDGRVVACDQDFQGRHVVGDLRQQSLGEIWRGPLLAELRRAHRCAEPPGHPMCAGCDEWHRP